MFYDDNNESIDSLDQAIDFMKKKFNWRAPVEQWRWASVKDMLEHFGKASVHGNRTIYGKALVRLSDNTHRKYKNGKPLALFPPIKE